jgi:hypothetical protein
MGKHQIYPCARYIWMEDGSEEHHLPIYCVTYHIWEKDSYLWGVSVYKKHTHSYNSNEQYVHLWAHVFFCLIPCPCSFYLEIRLPGL